MNRSLPTPLQRLLWRETRVVQSGLSEKVSTADQRRTPCRCGDGVDEVTKLVFREPHFERPLKYRSNCCCLILKRLLAFCPMSELG